MNEFTDMPEENSNPWPEGRPVPRVPLPDEVTIGTGDDLVAGAEGEMGDDDSGIRDTGTGEKSLDTSVIGIEDNLGAGTPDDETDGEAAAKAEPTTPASDDSIPTQANNITARMGRGEQELLDGPGWEMFQDLGLVIVRKTEFGFAVDIDFGTAAAGEGGDGESSAITRIALDQAGNLIVPSDQPPEPPFLEFKQPFDETYTGVPAAERKATAALFGKAHEAIMEALPDQPTAVGKASTASVDGMHVEATTRIRESGGVVRTEKRIKVFEEGPADPLYTGKRMTQYLLDDCGTVRRYDAREDSLGEKQSLAFKFEWNKDAYNRAHNLEIAKSNADCMAMMGTSNLPVGMSEVRTLLTDLGSRLGIMDKLQPIIEADYSASEGEDLLYPSLTTGWVRELTDATPMRPLPEIDAMDIAGYAPNEVVLGAPHIQTEALEAIKGQAFTRWADFVDVTVGLKGILVRSISMTYADTSGRIVPMRVGETPQSKDASILIRPAPGEPTKRYDSGRHLGSKGMVAVGDGDRTPKWQRVGAKEVCNVLHMAQHAKPQTIPLGQLTKGIKDQPWATEPELLAAGGKLEQVIGNILRREEAPAGVLSQRYVHPIYGQIDAQVGMREQEGGGRQPFATINSVYDASLGYRQEAYPDVDKHTPVIIHSQHEFTMKDGKAHVTSTLTETVDGQIHKRYAGKKDVDENVVRLLRNFLANPTFDGAVQRTPYCL
jgi:hypothetical protein